MPILTPTLTVTPSKDSERLTAFSMRGVIARMSIEPAPGRMTTNSSPPSRPTTSSGRTAPHAKGVRHDLFRYSQHDRSLRGRAQAGRGQTDRDGEEIERRSSDDVD